MKIMFINPYPPAASSNLNPEDDPTSYTHLSKKSQCGKMPLNPVTKTPFHDSHVTIWKRKIPNRVRTFMHSLRNRFTGPRMILESAIVTNEEPNQIQNIFHPQFRELILYLNP